MAWASLFQDAVAAFWTVWSVRCKLAQAGGKEGWRLIMGAVAKGVVGDAGGISGGWIDLRCIDWSDWEYS